MTVLLPEGFTASVRFRPAYDCVVIQPCKFGSKHCYPGSGGSHGRGSVRMYLVLLGPAGAVNLTISTDWDIDATPKQYQSRGAHTAGLHYHSPIPLRDDQTSFPCEYLPEGRCYGDGGYGIADEPWRILREEGEDAFWAEMMRWYEEWLVKTEEEVGQ